MDLFFLDGDFNFISDPVDDYTSFVWTENWYSSGKFDLYLPKKRFAMIKNAKYIYNQNNDEYAVLTRRLYQSEDNGVKVAASGKTLESILNRRVIDAETLLNDTVENACRTLLTRFAMTGGKTIPKLEMSPKTGFIEAYEGTVAVGTNLETCLYDILKPHDMTYRIRYDRSINKLLFNILKSVDRTQAQSANTWAIFSTDFENLSKPSYEINDEDYKNFAYVTGTYENQTIIETVDQTNGEERRELYISASISSDEVSSATQFRAALRQRGIEALAEYQVIENLKGDIDINGSLAYGIDYNLGDKCDIVVPEIGMSWSAILSSIDHVYESSRERIVPKFGEEVLSPRKYMERELKK